MQVDPYLKEFTDIKPLEAFFPCDIEDIEVKIKELEETGKIVARGSKEHLQALQDDLRKLEYKRTK